MTELLKARIYLAGALLILLIADVALVVGAIEVDHHPHSPAYYLLALAGAAAAMLWIPAVTSSAAARYRLAKHQIHCPGPPTPITPAATKC